MRKKLVSLAVSAAMLVTSLSVPVFANGDSGAAELSSDTGAVIAFEGAEGGGMYTEGARGALNGGEKIEVYHVTSLADSGAGTFRDAVSRGNRIVVFDVSGYIDLDTNVSITHDNMTILGQTAPGDGVCFRGNNIKVGANNVILRYLRFRVGDKLANGDDTRAQDGLEITDNCQNVIIDHCSVTWGTDENLSAYAVKDVTVQWSLIAEALNMSVHDKGEHSYAGIWGGVNLSVHHNLIATHKSRNPKVGTSETVAMTEGYTDDQTLVDMRNNVIYNWGDKAGYGSENGAKTYLINNVYKPGPSTPSGKRARIFELSVGNKYQTDYLGSVYAEGNQIMVGADDPDYSDAQIVNQDNWQDDRHIGVYVDTGIYNRYGGNYNYDIKIEEPDDQYREYERNYPIDTDETNEVFDEVVNGAGVTLPVRDDVDTRIVNDVINGTAPNMDGDGVNDSIGLLDSPTDVTDEYENGVECDGRGYPVIETVTRDVSEDLDNDGIPNVWEDRMGLDSGNPNDSTNISPRGYTWLEEYVEEVINKQNGDAFSAAIDATDDYVTAGSAVEISIQNMPADVVKAELYSDVDGYLGDVEINGGGGTSITDYSGGVVTVERGGYEGEMTAVVAGYNADRTLADIKYAAIPSGENSVEVGEVTADTVRVFLWNNIADMIPLCGEYKSDITLGAGENNIVAKLIKSDGSYELTSNKTIYVTGNTTDPNWTGAENTYDGNEYALVPGQELTQSADGDFQYFAQLSSMSNTDTGTTAYIGYGDLGVGIRYNQDHQAEVVYKTGAGGEYQAAADLPYGADEYSMFRIVKSGVNVKLYAGRSLAEWTEIADLAYSGGSAAVVGVSSEDANEMAVVKFDSLRIVTEESNPSIDITNVENNSRLDFNTTLSVDVTPDIGGITEIWVYLNDDVIESITYDEPITSERTITIPLSFATVDAGTLRVMCFDENLGSAESSREVSVSQDIAPWQIADIGMSETDTKTYVSMTQDYTAKIYTADGEIGGTSDKFGYMYQQFSGDARMYYRVRLSASSQIGAVLKPDLDADGITYYFGVNADGDSRRYQLMARDSVGGEMQVIRDFTDQIGVSDNKLFIFEKAGDTINIYQSQNNGAGYYKENELLYSFNCQGIGDMYYMGFGAVNTNGINSGVNAGDVGWLVLDEFSADNMDAYTWSLDHGLDFGWQSQNSTMLMPEWSEEAIGGNDTGKLVIRPDSDYSADTYIFREYLPAEDMTPIIDYSYDIFISGDDSGVNTYLQTRSGDTAFKVSFEDEGDDGRNIYIADQKIENTSFDTGKWYTVRIVSDQGIDAGLADITISETGGETVADVEDCANVTFRTQNNIEKKVPVTNGMFFEAMSGKSGTYYIDNISVSQIPSEFTVETVGRDIWKFDGLFGAPANSPVTGQLSGETMTTIGSITTQEDSRTIDGESFNYCIRPDNGSVNSNCLKFNVPAGDTTIRVYAASASSSQARTLVVNDDGVANNLSIQERGVYEYNRSGDGGEITIYVLDGIRIYGVAYETTQMVGQD